MDARLMRKYRLQRGTAGYVAARTREEGCEIGAGVSDATSEDGHEAERKELGERESLHRQLWPSFAKGVAGLGG